jgi:putative ABC transport system permease protein
MVKNYLLITLRFMSKQRGFSVINISGLTIGIACSLLIILYLQDELRYDRFHSDYERIYRIGFEGKLQGRKLFSAKTGFPLAATLPEESDAIESSTRIVTWATFPVRYEDKSYTEPYLLLADPDFFRFFNFILLEGNPDSVLFGERKVVISESAAKRYFNYKGKGDVSPIGKTLHMAQDYTVRVSGIAADAPRNSHFHYSLILSLDSWDAAKSNDWISNQVFTYFKMKEEADPESVEQKINQLISVKLNDELTRSHELTLEKFKKQGNEFNYFIQHLPDIHLTSDLNDEIEPNGSIEYIYLFASIAVFITLIACINFINLTTAQSAGRAKEVAVRKAVGAQNSGLIFQFLIESYFYVTMAVILAFGILIVVLAPFNYFTGKELAFGTIVNGYFLLGIFTFVFLTGLVAGSYPSFYLTHYSPVEVLKGNLRARLRTYGIRNVLVIFQFFISSALIIATMMVYHQLQYAQKFNLGFNKQNVINLLHTRNLGNKGRAFKEELIKHPSILSASYCSRLPPNIDWQSLFRVPDNGKDFLFAVYEMDYDHLKTMGYQMVDGRYFSRDSKDDTLKLIINQQAAEKLGIKDFEGHKLFSGYDHPDGRIREIIGIIRDFNYQSVKDPIQPMAVVLGTEPNWEMAVRIENGKLDEGIELLRTLWKKNVPDAPFEYTLLENNFETKLQTEHHLGLLFFLFTVLAILIACLGLFGLAAFTAEQQRKSIGIRKVLGATIPDLARMLNKNFLKLVLIANLLAWPATWYIMSQWLDQFAYRINQPWWIFCLAGGITVLIAFFSVSFQALKAASGNPVNSLRNE